MYTDKFIYSITNTNIKEMYVYSTICERAERASLENVGIFTF